MKLTEEAMQVQKTIVEQLAKEKMNGKIKLAAVIGLSVSLSFILGYVSGVSDTFGKWGKYFKWLENLRV